MRVNEKTLTFHFAIKSGKCDNGLKRWTYYGAITIVYDFNIVCVWKSMKLIKS